MDLMVFWSQYVPGHVAHEIGILWLLKDRIFADPAWNRLVTLPSVEKRFDIFFFRGSSQSLQYSGIGVMDSSSGAILASTLSHRLKKAQCWGPSSGYCCLNRYPFYSEIKNTINVRPCAHLYTLLVFAPWCVQTVKRYELILNRNGGTSLYEQYFSIVLHSQIQERTYRWRLVCQMSQHKLSWSALHLIYLRYNWSAKLWYHGVGEMMIYGSFAGLCPSLWSSINRNLVP